jgi:cytochrome c
MNSFEFNKIAGAVLGTALVVFGLNELSGILYHSEAPEKPGFAVEVAEAGAAEGEAAGGEQPATAASLGTLLASADAAKGQTVFKACAACHDASKGGPNKVGPNLWGIVGRNHGIHEGFAYSEAMAKLSDKPWTYEALNEFIHAPKQAVPGTKMAYGGLKKDQDRANLLAYLQTLSDAPVPFPAP